MQNDLKTIINTKDSEGNSLKIVIRLSDECKNGHQDFSITGTIYKKDKPQTDKYFLSGGCIHEEILKVRPDLKIFVNLHLCDYKGIPMYAVENGFYHLQNGFNSTPIDSVNFKAKFCEYYRITEKQFEKLATSKNKLQYAINLKELNILEQWEEEAKKAIGILEQMAGKKFLIDSLKTCLNMPKDEEIAEEIEKQKNGYYSPEKEAEREAAKQANLLAKLEEERDKGISKHVEEFEVKRAVLLVAGEKALNNCIYYNHTKTLAFNWISYDQISEETYNNIVASIKLPEGIKIENQKGGRH